MAQFNEFTIPQKQYAVFADYITATHRMDTHGFRIPLANMSFPPVHECDAGLPHLTDYVRNPPGSTGRSILFLTVMRLHDLYIIFRQGGCRLFNEPVQMVDTE